MAPHLSPEMISKVASEAKSRDVDGLCLLNMTSEAWKELGIMSAVDCAKMESEVKRLSLSTREGEITKPKVAEQNLYDARAQRALLEMKRHFTSTPVGYFCKVPRTKEGGAEHRPDWALAIANANSNGAEVKQHIHCASRDV